MKQLASTGWALGARATAPLGLGLLLATALVGCAPDDTVITSQVQPIVGGTIDNGHPEVVFLFRSDGAGCTGTIIAPRLVLTAAHCVQARSGAAAPGSTFRVFTGTSVNSLTGQYFVQEARLVGSGNPQRAEDVGVLILSSPAQVTPREISRAPASQLWGQTITAVGFGQTPQGGGNPTKYTTTAQVQQVQSGLVIVPPTVCSGDSGGPLIGPDGLVWGVASFIFSPDGRSQPVCGTAPGAYNAIFQHLAWLDQQLMDAGTCVSSGNEVCDGTDNDCDDTIDEGCNALGEACTSGDQCFGGLCANTADGQICATRCDPLRPNQGCDAGSYCALTPGTCDGYCVPGQAGQAGINADCTRNTDCASLNCVDPGDGRARCLAACQGDTGSCLSGEVCAALPGACGACVPRGLVADLRGLGEPCTVDTECRSGMCRDVGGARECSAMCSSDSDCGDRFECRDSECRRDRRQGIGGVCESNADCADGICAAANGRSWCTDFCNSDGDCPSGFTCQDAGSARVCGPVSGLTGETCGDGMPACASTLCAAIPDRGQVCTSFCDADNACPTGFECVRIGDGTQAVCSEVVVATDGGGCAAAPSTGSTPWLPPLALLTIVGVALLRRRRR